jgi:hypothetical protein
MKRTSIPVGLGIDRNYRIESLFEKQAAKNVKKPKTG